MLPRALGIPFPCNSEQSLARRAPPLSRSVFFEVGAGGGLSFSKKAFSRKSPVPRSHCTSGKLLIVEVPPLPQPVFFGVGAGGGLLFQKKAPSRKNPFPPSPLQQWKIAD